MPAWLGAEQLQEPQQFLDDALSLEATPSANSRKRKADEELKSHVAMLGPWSFVGYHSSTTLMMERRDGLWLIELGIVEQVGCTVLIFHQEQGRTENWKRQTIKSLVPLHLFLFWRA